VLASLASDAGITLPTAKTWLGAPLSFWRDASGREVDLLVDAGDRVLPIEIKSGMTVASDAFDPLRAWNAIAGQKTGVLVHGGEQALEQHGLVVRPWFLA